MPEASIFIKKTLRLLNFSKFLSTFFTEKIWVTASVLIEFQCFLTPAYTKIYINLNVFLEVTVNFRIPRKLLINTGRLLVPPKIIASLSYGPNRVKHICKVHWRFSIPEPDFEIQTFCLEKLHHEISSAHIHYKRKWFDLH